MAFDPENEDVLNRMRSQGDDITQPREVDFVVVFADEHSAETFAHLIVSPENRVSVSMAGVQESFPWDVRIKRVMAPTNDSVTSFEEELAELAKPYGGKNDGWGCFTQVSEKNIQ